jgi:hypothetical protein
VSSDAIQDAERASLAMTEGNVAAEAARLQVLSRAGECMEWIQTTCSLHSSSDFSCIPHVSAPIRGANTWGYVPANCWVARDAELLPVWYALLLPCAAYSQPHQPHRPGQKPLRLLKPCWQPPQQCTASWVPTRYRQQHWPPSLSSLHHISPKVTQITTSRRQCHTWLGFSKKWCAGITQAPASATA